MVISDQKNSVTPGCQRTDKPARKNKEKEMIPPTWKLTPEQRAFIDAVVEDDNKKH